MIKKLLGLKIVRYGMAAAIATSVDVLMYFVTFNYILHKQDFTYFSPLVISSPTLSLAVSYTCGLLTNFTITKYFVFTDSDLRGRHQLMRYVMVAFLVLILNYGLMSFLIRGLEWFPTIARAFSAVVIGFLSFAIHKTFSFRGNSAS